MFKLETFKIMEYLSGSVIDWGARLFLSENFKHGIRMAFTRVTICVCEETAQNIKIFFSPRRNYNL
jgi:hypothetical protein